MNTKRCAIIQGIADEVSDQVRQIIENATKSCVNCLHFDEQKELCNLAPDRGRPPARIIAAGCECWEDDGTIPF